MMVANKKKFNKIILNNVNDIKQFITSNISDCKVDKSPYKILINCPYCDKGKHKHKMIINLDWGNYRCYKCEEHGSISKLMKIFNLYDKFLDLLTSLNDISIYNIKTMLRNNNAEQETLEVKVDEISNDNIVKNFITQNNMVSINEIKEAKKYALKRVYNNANEIENYMADKNYIYIPIIMDDLIVAYMGRLYNKKDNYARYNMKVVRKSPCLIGFYDEVINNMSTNSIYLTEGYFDSYAINYAMGNYVSMCMFGKNKGKSVVNFISDKFPSNTKIYITLDSKKKDNDIYTSNRILGEHLIKYFPSVNIIELSDEDPSDILDKYGVFKLKEELSKSTPYLKYAIMNSKIKKNKES